MPGNHRLELLLAAVALALNVAAGAQDIPANGLTFGTPRISEFSVEYGFFQDMVAVDFDVDGHEDIVASYDHQWWLMRNLRNGAVEGYALDVQNMGSITSWRVVQWDDDGLPDLLLLTFEGNVAVARGNGAGPVHPPELLLADSNDRNAFAVGDVDGDGHTDIVLMEKSPPALRVLLGRGDGTIKATHIQSQPELYSALRLGDFTGDGAPDLACAKNAAADFKLVVQTGDGLGGFTRATEYPLFNTTSFIGDVCDLDDDGDVDLIMVHGTELEVFANDGTGSLQQVDSMQRGYDHTLTDLDQDGTLDILTADFGNELVRVHRGQGDGTFDEITPIDVGGGPQQILALPLDGDGLPDFAVSTLRGFVLYTGTGTLDVRLGPQQDLTSTLDDLALGDLDGDGLLDAVCPSASQELLFALRGTGTERFGPPASWPAGGPAVDVELGDLDGDGMLDAVAAIMQFDGGVTVSLNDGVGGFAAPQFTPTGINATGVALTDLDEDGALDVLSVDRGTDRLTYLRGDGAGGLTPRGSWKLAIDPEALDVADLNGDGHSDVAVVFDSVVTDELWWFLGDGTGALAPAATLRVGDHAKAIELADVDDDGDVDAVLTRRLESRLVVALNDGAGDLSFGGSVRTVVAPHCVRVADVDADGHIDLVAGGLNGFGLHRGPGLEGWRQLHDHFEVRGPPSTLVGMAALDLEGAGALDIVASSRTGRLIIAPNRVSPWWPLGAPSPAAPTSAVLGSLRPNTPLTLRVDQGEPGSLVWVVAGLAPALQSFGDGTLIPQPDFLKALPLDAAGQLQLDTTWPDDVAAQTAIWLQLWSTTGPLQADAYVAVTP